MSGFQVAQKDRKNKLKQSGEDYLEAILMLKHQIGSVRSVDIARFMNISKPSVTNAMARLKKGGYVTMDQDGNLCLSDKGNAIAEKILERHLFFTDLLIKAGIPTDIAKRDACRIEHAFSEDSFWKFKEYIHTIFKDNNA